jgi:hypothetical protein
MTHRARIGGLVEYENDEAPIDVHPTRADEAVVPTASGSDENEDTNEWSVGKEDDEGKETGGDGAKEKCDLHGSIL